jgi:hypothetical protein
MVVCVEPVSSYSIIRNGAKFDFPIREAILSVVPFSKEIIINYGLSEDDTLNTLIELQKEIIDVSNGETCLKILVYDWDANPGEYRSIVQKGRCVDTCSYKWRFTFDMDEVFHEKNIDGLKKIVCDTVANPLFKEDDIYLFLFSMIHFW